MGKAVSVTPLSTLNSLARFGVCFGNRRDGAINPRPRDTAEEIWDRHQDDWKRLHDEEGLYAWQVRPSYHFITVLVETKSRWAGGPSKEAVAEKIRAVLGDRYGEISVKLENAQRGALTKPGEGCCGNQCLGCNNGNPQKRLHILG